MRMKASAFVVTLALASTTCLWASTWSVPADFLTIQDAIDSPDVAAGDTIVVAKGNHAGALVTKSLVIRGVGKATITTGPAHSSGLIMGFRLLADSDGTVISQLQFKVDLAIMNGAAVAGVTVDHCTFLNSIQAVSNWSGSGWEITHNVITDLRTRNGGGIGIFIGDYTGGVVEQNIVAYNKVTGTLHVSATDGGGYDGSGIVLYADFRWGRLGAEAIKNNYVLNNKVSLASDTPDVVDVNAVELTDSRDGAALIPVVFDNSIAFNDLRGTETQFLFTPESLVDYNLISRNLGNNRGKGLHPSLLRPIE